LLLTTPKKSIARLPWLGLVALDKAKIGPAADASLAP
jgi:hypothetical protein